MSLTNPFSSKTATEVLASRHSIRDTYLDPYMGMGSVGAIAGGTLTTTTQQQLDGLRNMLAQSSPATMPRLPLVGAMTILRANGGYVAVVDGALHVCTDVQGLHDVVTRMVGEDALKQKG